MNKKEAYRNLVEKRKKCFLCNDILNPSLIERGRYDSDEIGPWSLWQGNLDANIVVVGQDWGDDRTFIEWKGIDDPADGFPTNKNLKELLEIIGIQILNPLEQQEQKIFLTNLILCLKSGGNQVPVKDSWFTNCASAFFKPLIDIINPKIIIALGKKISDSILSVYGIPHLKSTSLKDIIEQSPYALSDTITLFPVFHCGSRGVNINRPMPLQQKDWEKIGKWLKNHTC